MAMTLAMDREPEVARFIDTYKFDQDMATKRDRFGGGTSLPLNSDGYEDKQRALRDERHKDWLVQQDKPKEPVYYRVGTPEQGFPGLGEYERQRQEKNIVRQKEYNEMLKKQRHAEQQKQEARRYAPQARPAQPLGPQMDYNAAGELAKAEEKKAYQDYMKAKEERYWALRGRPVTPPGGLNIGQYDRQVKEQAPQKKQEYKRMLDEQQKEHMFLRARQEPEMAVIDRNAQSSQFLANKPPPGPSYGRGRDETNSYSRPIPERPSHGQPPYPGRTIIQNDDQYNLAIPNRNYKPVSPEKPVDRELLKIPPKDTERPNEMGTPMAFKTDSLSQTLPEQSRNGQQFSQGEEMVGRPQSPANLPPRSPEKPINPEWLKRPVMDDELPPGVGTPLNEKRKHESEVFQQQHGGKPAEIVKNPFYSSDDYEKFQKELKKKQEIEYSEFLSKQYQPNKDAQGLPLGQYKYEPMRLHLEAERNKEYNELLEKQKVAHPGRRHEFVDSANGPYGGLFHGLGEHGNRSDDLNRERHREYNEKLEQQYAGRDRPGGRPKWVQESLPNNTDRGRSPMKTQPPTDQYQQMLNEKRREEANMRRYEDPEYQDRLAHGRDRGEAGQRYGY